MNFSLNLKSARARKARLSVILDNILLRRIISIAVLFCAAAAGGMHLAGVNVYVTALIVVFPTYFITLIIWYHGELKNLATGLRTQGFEALLERQVLGHLRPHTSPADIARVCAKLPGGIFFANRFAVSFEFLVKTVSDKPEDLGSLLERAADISAQNGRTEITAADISAALILSIENSDFYLAQLKLDSEDIASGVKWYDHFQQVLKTVKQKHSVGGIGRDLSFGWAPLLSNLGFNVSEAVASGRALRREVIGHNDALQQMLHVISDSSRRNAALVGQVGVGKTTLVHALAQKIMLNPKSVPEQLRYRQIIELDAASLISRSKGRGELEDIVIRIFNEAIHAKNIILFLDEAHLFLKEGTGSVDLSNILLPILEAGGLQIILAVDDQEWLKLSQQNTGLAQLLNRVVVNPLSEEDTMLVVEDQILLLEANGRVTYMYQSLKEAYGLANRFIGDQAFPGKAIHLLEAASSFPEDTYFITASSVEQAVEKAYDVKVQTANSEEERTVLLNLEGKIHERMINQTHAVKVVSDALRRARAGVRNQNKPIGTFLFLGPTGVGKTELSKALAATYFGGEDRLVRVDLNEFTQDSDVRRLLETGAENAHSLTAQISKQPFSVVLLDEIEKAHPNVLNVLLQMLDEGMLRDSQNKPVSFRDAIIIATSNAGADAIREHIQAGQSLEQFEGQFIDELISSNIFRPEFLNRFDETVLFRPLNQTELAQVVDLIVAGINKTLATQKISVQLSDQAKEILVQAGYDPRLGARPLRRVVQRSIENIIAQKLLSGQASPGSVVALEAPEIQAALSARSN